MRRNGEHMSDLPFKTSSRIRVVQGPVNDVDLMVPHRHIRSAWLGRRAAQDHAFAHIAGLDLPTWAHRARRPRTSPGSTHKRISAWCSSRWRCSHLTGENIAYPLRTPRRAQEIRETGRRAAFDIHLSGLFADRPVSKLSGGQRSAAIARALAIRRSSFCSTSPGRRSRQASRGDAGRAQAVGSRSSASPPSSSTTDPARGDDQWPIRRGHERRRDPAGCSPIEIYRHRPTAVVPTLSGRPI